jgi:hypothetical protein
MQYLRNLGREFNASFLIYNWVKYQYLVKKNIFFYKMVVKNLLNLDCF